jgi:DNA primase
VPFEPGIVAEVQAKVDLLSYVSQYVTLKKRGREYTGLCPFHPEKTPSFSLNAEKQVWHCYGCGAGGDLLKFVERYENVDFTTALRMLAQRAGVELRESPDARRQRSEREAIFEANAIAQAYFASSLRKDAGALEYVKRRGVTSEPPRGGIDSRRTRTWCRGCAQSRDEAAGGRGPACAYARRLTGFTISSGTV